MGIGAGEGREKVALHTPGDKVLWLGAMSPLDRDNQTQGEEAARAI